MEIQEKAKPSGFVFDFNFDLKNVRKVADLMSK